jgi:hypothetical protein
VSVRLFECFHSLDGQRAPRGAPQGMVRGAEYEVDLGPLLAPALVYAAWGLWFGRLRLPSLIVLDEPLDIVVGHNR